VIGYDQSALTQHEPEGTFGWLAISGGLTANRRILPAYRLHLE